jgi:uncharacterized protein
MKLDRAIRRIQAWVPELIAIYSFGSQSQGVARPDSDVDLAVLTSAPIPESRRFTLAQELAEISC